MPSDWDEALKLAGQGFGATILVLMALALITWLVGFSIKRYNTRKEKGGDTEQSDA